MSQYHRGACPAPQTHEWACHNSQLGAARQDDETSCSLVNDNKGTDAIQLCLESRTSPSDASSTVPLPTAFLIRLRGGCAVAAVACIQYFKYSNNMTLCNLTTVPPNAVRTTNVMSSNTHHSRIHGAWIRHSCILSVGRGGRRWRWGACHFLSLVFRGLVGIGHRQCLR